MYAAVGSTAVLRSLLARASHHGPSSTASHGPFDRDPRGRGYSVNEVANASMNARSSIAMLTTHAANTTLGTSATAAESIPPPSTAVITGRTDNPDQSRRGLMFADALLMRQ